MCILNSGCVSMQERFIITEKEGKEKIFDFPYKKVFYACEDALARGHFFYSEERPHLSGIDVERGQIWAHLAYPLEYVYITIVVKKIDDSQTLVKIREFHMPTQTFYGGFFADVERLLNRYE